MELLPVNLVWPSPDLSAAAFVADNATVMGHVSLAKGCSVWYGAILRGDIEAIRVGAYSNVQDGAILHGDLGYPTILEDYVTVGHRAVIHSAQVERGSLVGIGAVILNGVRVGSGSMIAAGAVVTKDVPPGSLVMGVPAQRVRSLTPEQQQTLLEHAQQYYQLALAHRQSTLKQEG
ncbi:MAG: gamma carbonic anhydrase family protein [Cyanobacteria bacterium REEB459]|nr:gamma carbonic anhydrase family protein [Cyanobacteria bacterium REEB459]